MINKIKETGRLKLMRTVQLPIQSRNGRFKVLRNLLLLINGAVAFYSKYVLFVTIRQHVFNSARRGQYRNRKTVNIAIKKNKVHSTYIR